MKSNGGGFRTSPSYAGKGDGVVMPLVVVGGALGGEAC